MDLRGNRSILNNLAAGQVFAETYAVCRESMMVDAVAAENCEVAFFNLNLLFNENNASAGWYIKLLNNSLRVFAQKNLALSNRIFCTTPKSVRGRYFCACNNNITKKINCEKTIDKAFCLRIISKKEVT